MTSPTNATPHSTTARFFLEGLQETGIRYLFSNLGTDHVTLIDEMARLQAEGQPMPEVVLCPHENVAIHMAGGYAAVTGQGQGVMVHVDAGTANAAMGMHNLMRARLPVLLMAGKSPYALHAEVPGARDNYVHYVQDPFDIASLVRPYVKWEYNLPSGVVAKEVVRRAHSVMHTEPAGPVYLTLPRETLIQPWAHEQVKSYSAERYGAVRMGALPAEATLQIARELMAADNPLVITSYLGRKPQAVHALEALAQLCGIRVVEFSPSWLCMSRDSPCFFGFDPTPLLPQTDWGLLLDIDVPWLPHQTRAREDTRWVHIDVDPIKKDFPSWGFASDVRWPADCAQALTDLHKAVVALADEAFHQRVAQRMAAWPAQHKQRLGKVAAAAQEPGQVDALNPAWVCAQIGLQLRPDDVVINEAIRNSPAVLQQIPRTQPMSFLGGAGGGLGYSAGMALGVKLARPHDRVVHIEGDGGFHFSTPTSVYAVAQAQGLPILTVVLDNGGWQAVKEAVLRVHPDGPAAQAGDFQARLKGSKRQFEQVAQAFGAHGERVSRPEDLPAAIGRCLQALDQGRAALLVASVAKI
ncbi:thiamine pyrophosphate-requiring protein [Limnohabitans sp. Rim8]|uniref:thiamine pyrophosphate-requiring protein n=1 Tax=Limnohabitans sp. Rim8 TaxID=1100718 RepID=UPI002626E77D|nr:thiamine pyrophosphate-requiring protein [Limnohabitans sp. Rim8]